MVGPTVPCKLGGGPIVFTISSGSKMSLAKRKVIQWLSVASMFLLCCSPACLGAPASFGVMQPEAGAPSITGTGLPRRIQFGLKLIF